MLDLQALVFVLALFAVIETKGRTIIFLEGGGGGGEGMKNIEKKYVQGLNRQNKLLANMICVKTLVCISKKMFAEVHMLKKVFRGTFSYPPPPHPLQKNNGPSLKETFH